jgi:hypothetical protein
MKYSVDTWEGMLKTKNEQGYGPGASAGAISNDVYTKNKEEKSKQKQEGGKLITPDDVVKLLFE